MGVQDPGSLTVQCDRCEREEEMDTTAYCGDPESFGVDDSTIQEKGWLKTAGEILCPDCAKEEADEEGG
jgi:hypothetical protein